MKNVALKYRILHLCYKYIIFLDFQWRNGVYLGLLLGSFALLEDPFWPVQGSEKEKNSQLMQYYLKSPWLSMEVATSPELMKTEKHSLCINRQF